MFRQRSKRTDTTFGCKFNASNTTQPFR